MNFVMMLGFLLESQEIKSSTLPVNEIQSKQKYINAVTLKHKITM